MIPDPGPDILVKYFPELRNEPEKMKKFEQLFEPYDFWNQRINLISRKDFSHFYLHHVLHSLSIAKIFSFHKEHRILDAGTGGGFPGIPLAIFFPEASFTLVDSIEKKIQAVAAIARSLNLSNVIPVRERIEKLRLPPFDYILSRALAPTPDILKWSKHLLRNSSSGTPCGYFLLKGGNLDKELQSCTKEFSVHTTPLQIFFDELFFNDKKIVFLSKINSYE